MEVAEHDDGLDVFFVDHFPEFGDALGSGGLGKDGEVLAVDDGLHVAGVAVVVGGAVACDTAVVVWDDKKRITDEDVNISILIGLLEVNAFLFIMEVSRTENLSQSIKYFELLFDLFI